MTQGARDTDDRSAQHRQNWRTPLWLFEQLNKEFGPFTLDAAASPENALCEEYFTKRDNGLDRSWSDRCVFVNPPFRTVSKWVDKAIKEFNRSGTRTVMLAPASVNSMWFHKACSEGRILIPNKRIAYWHPGHEESNPDRDSVIALFGHGCLDIDVFDVRNTLVSVKIRSL